VGFPREKDAVPPGGVASQMAVKLNLTPSFDDGDRVRCMAEIAADMRHDVHDGVPSHRALLVRAVVTHWDTLSEETWEALLRLMEASAPPRDELQGDARRHQTKLNLVGDPICRLIRAIGELEESPDAAHVLPGAEGQLDELRQVMRMLKPVDRDASAGLPGRP
jgi:hypothetical protein